MFLWAATKKHSTTNWETTKICSRHGCRGQESEINACCHGHAVAEVSMEEFVSCFFFLVFDWYQQSLVFLGYRYITQSLPLLTLDVLSVCLCLYKEKALSVCLLYTSNTTLTALLATKSVCVCEGRVPNHAILRVSKHKLVP